MNPTDKIDILIKQLNTPASPELNARMNALIEQSAKIPDRPLNIWRKIMKSTIFKTAAAVIIIGVSVVFLVPTGGESIPLAAVYDKVLQANTIIYRTKMFIPGESIPRETINWISTDYGMKTESYINGKVSVIQYALPKQKRMVSVLPNEKQYIEVEADEEQYATLDRLKNDPRELVRRMMDVDHKSLGNAIIDGIEAEGFESNDPQISGSGTILLRIWVDVTTLCPVQLEKEDSILDESSVDGKRITIRSLSYDFQWNVDISKSAFMPVIPDDYTLQDTIILPKFDENAAIKGLRKFAEMTGRFPVSMGKNEFMEEVNKAIKNSLDPDMLKGLSSQEMREQAAPFQSLYLFYGILLHDKKDPAYYGDRVTPADVDAVLMRWKTDSGKYMVIFGDLSSVEMDYEDLIKIEPEAEPNSVPK